MFDIGLQELIIIFIVALLVFGPKRLPELAKTLGRGVGEMKKAFQDVKEQVEHEFGDAHKEIDNVLKNSKHSILEDMEDSKHPPDKETK